MQCPSIWGGGFFVDFYGVSDKFGYDTYIKCYKGWKVG